MQQSPSRAPENTGRLIDALNELLSAERAGTQVATHSRQEATQASQIALLEQINQGEADSCRRLLTCLQHLGATPTRARGAFYEKAMAIADLDQRLAFVDKGQQWVIRKLRELLPGIDDALIREQLEAVLATHETNSEAMRPDGA